MPYKDKDQQREYQNAWLQKRRQNWIDANGPCVDCGSTEDLEVDHVNTSTKVDHKVWSWREDRRLAELAKCVVRCHDCHVIKSSTEKAKGEKHGNSILTVEQVKEIRRQHKLGISIKSLAKNNEIAYYTAYDIITRQTWRHV